MTIIIYNNKNNNIFNQGEPISKSCYQWLPSATKKEQIITALNVI